jgi:hypothetical protein
MQDPVKDTFNAVIDSIGYALKKSDTSSHIEISINHDGSWGVNVVELGGRIVNLPERDNPYDSLLDVYDYIKEA